MMTAVRQLSVPDEQPDKTRYLVAISTPRFLAREKSHHGYKGALDGGADCHARPLGVGDTGSRASENDEVPTQSNTHGVDMTIRTTEASVRFQRPFVLNGSERIYPAGAYRVVTDEEMIDGLSFLAYRRVSTMMFVPGRVPGGSSMEMIVVDPADLETAQRTDVVMDVPGILKLNS
jgi:hypothetical protein